MAAKPSGPHLQDVTRRWHSLAEQRLAYYVELYRTGRWQHYYTRDQFAARMIDVIRATRVWGELAGESPQRRTGAPDSGLRPAA